MMKYLPLFTAIEDLLQSKNTLLIPQIGTFSLEAVSAALYLQQNEVMPPKATLNFNPDLKEDDGVLLEYLYETQGVSKRTCQLLLDKWIAGILSDLQEKSSFQISNLGTLILDDNDVLKFEPIERNFDIATADLPILHNLNPVGRLQEQYTANPIVPELEVDNDFEVDFSFDDEKDTQEEVLEESVLSDSFEAHNQSDKNYENIATEEEVYAANYTEEAEAENSIFLPIDNDATESENTIESIEEKVEESPIVAAIEPTEPTTIIAPTPPTNIVANNNSNTAKKKSSNKLIFIILGFLLLALIIWLIFRNKGTKSNKEIAENNIENTQVLDSTNTDNSVDSSAWNAAPKELESIVNEPSKVGEEVSNPRAQNTSPNAKTYIIVIGAFAEQKYVDRSLRLLKKEGYFPNIVTTGKGLQRIGVEITCTQEELKLHLKDIRRKFHPDAWVVKD